MFDYARRNRLSSAPPRLQSQRQRRARSAKPNLRMDSRGMSPSLSKSFSMGSSSQPLASEQARASSHHRTPVRKTRPKPFHNPTPVTPQNVRIDESGLRSFASLEREHQRRDTYGDILNLSFPNDWSAGISQSPESSQDQPRTPSPGKVISRFKDRYGVLHEVPVVIVDDDMSDDEKAVEDNKLGATTWNRTRLRNHPSKIEVVKNDEDGVVVMEGPLVTSIERDQTVAPGLGVSAIPSVELTSGDHASKSYDCISDSQTQEDHDVKRIVGEKIGPNKHEFRIEWIDFEGLDWIPEKDCFCPDAIDDFRALQKDELRSAFIAGRRDDAERLLALADAAGIDIDAADFPKHCRWKRVRRNANGRFARRGAKDLVLEITREPTVARHLRANTARPPNKRCLAGSPDNDHASNEDEVVWIFTKVREGVHLQEPDLKREDERDMDHDLNEDDAALEQTEFQSRPRQNAEQVHHGKDGAVAGMERQKPRTKAAHKGAQGRNTARRDGRQTTMDRKKAEKKRRRVAKSEIKQRKQEAKRAAKKARQARKRQKAAQEDTKRKEVEVDRALEEEQRLLEETKRRQNEIDRARADKQKQLEETVRKYCSPTIVEGQRVVELNPAVKSTNRKLQQTLVDTSRSASHSLNARLAASASLINQARCARASSTASINTKFRNARAAEAKAKVTAKQSLVRSEFRETLGGRQAAALIKHSRIIPPWRRG